MDASIATLQSWQAWIQDPSLERWMHWHTARQSMRVSDRPLMDSWEREWIQSPEGWTQALHHLQHSLAGFVTENNASFLTPSFTLPHEESGDSGTFASDPLPWIPFSTEFRAVNPVHYPLTPPKTQSEKPFHLATLPTLTVESSSLFFHWLKQHVLVQWKQELHEALKPPATVMAHETLAHESISLLAQLSSICPAYRHDESSTVRGLRRDLLQVWAHAFFPSNATTRPLIRQAFSRFTQLMDDGLQDPSSAWGITPSQRDSIFNFLHGAVQDWLDDSTPVYWSSIVPDKDCRRRSAPLDLHFRGTTETPRDPWPDLTYWMVALSLCPLSTPTRAHTETPSASFQTLLHDQPILKNRWMDAYEALLDRWFPKVSPSARVPSHGLKPVSRPRSISLTADDYPFWASLEHLKESFCHDLSFALQEDRPDIFIPDVQRAQRLIALGQRHGRVKVGDATAMIWTVPPLMELSLSPLPQTAPLYTTTLQEQQRALGLQPDRLNPVVRAFFDHWSLSPGSHDSLSTPSGSFLTPQYHEPSTTNPVFPSLKGWSWTLMDACALMQSPQCLEALRMHYPQDVQQWIPHYSHLQAAHGLDHEWLRLGTRIRSYVSPTRAQAWLNLQEQWNLFPHAAAEAPSSSSDSSDAQSFMDLPSPPMDSIGWLLLGPDSSPPHATQPLPSSARHQRTLLELWYHGSTLFGSLRMKGKPEALEDLHHLFQAILWTPPCHDSNPLTFPLQSLLSESSPTADSFLQWKDHMTVYFQHPPFREWFIQEGASWFHRILSNQASFPMALNEAQRTWTDHWLVHLDHHLLQHQAQALPTSTLVASSTKRL